MITDIVKSIFEIQKPTIDIDSHATSSISSDLLTDTDADSEYPAVFTYKENSLLRFVKK